MVLKISFQRLPQRLRMTSLEPKFNIIIYYLNTLKYLNYLKTSLPLDHFVFRSAFLFNSLDAFWLEIDFMKKSLTIHFRFRFWDHRIASSFGHLFALLSFDFVLKNHTFFLALHTRRLQLRRIRSGNLNLNLREKILISDYFYLLTLLGRNEFAFSRNENVKIDDGLRADFDHFRFAMTSGRSYGSGSGSNLTLQIFLLTILTRLSPTANLGLDIDSIRTDKVVIFIGDHCIISLTG